LIRVLFVTSVFEDIRTGPGIYAHYLWNSFKDDPEFEFHVIAPRFNQPHPHCHATGVEHGAIRLPRALCRMAIKLANTSHRLTIIHVNSSHVGTSILNLGIPVLGQINDYENADALRHFFKNFHRSGLRRAMALLWRRQIERRCVNLQAKTICNSEYTRRSVISAYRPRDTKRINTVYKAVDLKAFKRPQGKLEDPLDRKEGVRKLLFIGSNFVVKGLDTLVTAIAALPSAHLSIAGVEQITFKSKFPHLAVRIPGHRVSFCGRVERELLRRIMWTSDLLVLPSRSEALGVVLLEAIAAGLPVVASRVGGIPEIVTHQDIGELVYPDNTAELGEAIERQLRLSIPKSARTHAQESVLKRFSKERMIRAIRSVYMNEAR
jgi:glycosyltransferase involved in cell wall biosynthesis